MHSMPTKMISFIRRDDGATAVIFGLILALVVGAAGLAIDAARLYSVRSKLQGVTDLSALAGAEAAARSGSGEASRARSYFLLNASQNESLVGSTVQVEIEKNAVKVTAEQIVETTLMHVLSGSQRDVRVEATSVAAFPAVASGGSACLIALNSADPWGINMGSASGIDANCGVFVNNASSQAIRLGSGSLAAQFTAVVGDWQTRSDFTYLPVPVNAPRAISDPLSDLLAPPVGSCTFSKKRVADSDPHTLSPGVYCGGLEITTSQAVTLKPGVYVISDGAFKLGSSAHVSGDGVFFYLVGSNAVLDWGSGAYMAFAAPTSGAYQGMLIWGAGAQNSPHVLGSHTDSKLQGVVYSPLTEVIIGCNGTVGAKADWTAWVVRSLEVGSSATLKIRADYDGSSTTLPDAVLKATSMVAAGSFRLIE